MRTLLVIFILLVFFAFDHQSLDYSPRLELDYEFVEIDQSILGFRESVYLPVYTESYFSVEDEYSSILASVHIENNSIIEPIYILSADYYDVNGNRSQKLIEQVIRIEAQQAIQLTLDSAMVTNSAGLNVIVDWGAGTIDKRPRIYISVSCISATGTITVREEGIIISDQDEIMDRRPL